MNERINITANWNPLNIRSTKGRDPDIPGCKEMFYSSRLIAEMKLESVGYSAE
jgi:hypothetical protein